MGLPMWAVLATIEFVIFGFVTASLVRFYASKGSPSYALGLVFISWYLGFFGTLFLPIDIAEAYFSQYTNITNVTEIDIVFLPTPSVTPSWAPFTPIIILPSASPSAGAISDTNGTVWNTTVTTTGTGTATVTGTATWTYSALPSQAVNASTSSGSTATLAASASVSASGAPPAPVVSTTASPIPASSSSSSPTVFLTPTTSLSASRSPTRSITGTPSRTPSGTPSHTPTASHTPTPSGKWKASASASSHPGGDCEFGCGRVLEDGAADADDADDASDGAAASKGVYGRRMLPQSGTGSSGGRRAAGVRGLVSSNSSNGGDTVIPPSPGGNSSNATISNSTAVVVDWELAKQVVQLRNGPLEQMWMFVYWVTFLLTYIIIPVTQEYLAAGEFTKKGRLYASLKINIIFYAICGVIAFGALAYVVVGLDQGLWDIMPVIISLANTSGLVIVILLLGYGTAEFPTAIWKRSHPESALKRQYFKAPELDGQVFDVRQQLIETLKKIQEFEEKVTQMSTDKSFQAEGRGAAMFKELQRCIGIVNRKTVIAKEMLGKDASKVQTASSAAAAAKRSAAYQKAQAKREEEDKEEEEKDSNSFFGAIGKAFGGSTNKYKGITPNKLAKLHKRLMFLISKLKKTQFRFDALVTDCIELEYIVAHSVPPVPIKKKTAEGKTFYVIPKAPGADATGNSASGHGKGAVIDSKKGGNSGSGSSKNGGIDDPNLDVLSEQAAHALMGMMCMPRWFGGVLNRASWNFKIYAVPYVYKLLWLMCETLSILLLWSEATIFVNLQGWTSQNLSVFGWVLKWADDLGGHSSYIAIQLAAFIPLLYMCICSTFAVFRLKLFDMMDLSGNKNTDPYSLLVCSSLFNRLQFALAFNYLNVLMHSNNKADYPNTAFLNSVGARMDLSLVDWYLPIIAAVIYLLCKCSMFDRCMRKIGIEQSGDPVNGNRDHDNIIRDGILVVKKGRRTLGLGGGGDGASEEDREKQDALARNRLQAVMARAQARREGRNPDDVARLDIGDPLAASGAGVAHDNEGDLELAHMKGASGGYASGGSAMSSTQGMVSLSQFSGAGAGGGNAPAAGGPPLKGGLAALAQRAGMNKLGNAFTQLTGNAFGTASSDPSDGYENSGPTIDHGEGYDTADYNGNPLGNNPAASNGGGGGGAVGFGSFSRHDRATADLLRSTALGGAGSGSAAVHIEAPPTLADLLKGKRKL